MHNTLNTIGQFGDNDQMNRTNFDTITFGSQFTNGMAMIKQRQKNGTVQRAYKCALNDVMSECTHARYGPQSIKLGTFFRGKHITPGQKIVMANMKDLPPPSPRRPCEKAIEFVEPRRRRVVSKVIAEEPIEHNHKKSQPNVDQDELNHIER